MDEQYNEIIVFIFVGSFFVLFLAIIIIFAIIRYNRRQQKHYQEKQLMQTQFSHALLQTQIEIQDQTLKTISEEIHDNVGQVLSLAKLNLNTLGEIKDEQLLKKITDTKDFVGKAINDLRNLSRSLHGENIGDIGLPEAVTNELKILQNAGQFATDLKITGEVYKLDPQKEMVLFRIVQEASHNTLKHAKATHLKLVLDYAPELFTLTIHDNGKGFEPEILQPLHAGIGLKSMQNRATLIGGVFSIESSKNNGTSISIKIPQTIKPLNH